jgi:uncharacterized membrane protein HdeD (DUF308 family)
MLSNPLLTCALFCGPAVAIALTARHSVANTWRTAVWTIALLVLGSACLANALRCGRVHCYVTGPFFLLMALASLLYGIGILPLGGSGWSVIGAAILVGAIALSCLPEMLFGKYRSRVRSGVHR